jgi:hypothetical protein
MSRWVLISCAIRFYFAAAAVRGEGFSYPPKVSIVEIRHRIESADHGHPRLLATREQLKALPSSLDNEPLRKQLAEMIVKQANSLLDAPPVKRKLVGIRLLTVSRRCLDRVLTLATAYYVTGDARYVRRCEKEMLAAARFSDWNPSHFLDVGEMTCALAIGYDWLYDELDEASRKEIRSAIVEKALRVPFETKFNHWVRARNNWGQVCHGGLTMGALAVMDDEPDLAARTVQNALDNVVVSMAAYSPHGSFPEGPGYWGYGTSYNVVLIAALESVLQTDFALASAPGFSETGGYPSLVYGPSGQYFNYADGGAGRGPDPILFWFASRFGRPEWLLHERDLWNAMLNRQDTLPVEASPRFMPFALLWMKDAAEPDPEKLPLSWTGGGNVPIAVHRSSWTDPRATLVGVKAGSPTASHGHMDIGSFVLDSDGVRWAIDLGAEGYFGLESKHVGLWNNKPGGQRWSIFRLNNLSHNTLVIDDLPQVVTGSSKITEFSDRPERAFSIVDMTPAYEGQVKSARRGFRLLPSGEVVVQDELTGLRPGSKVRWGMVTAGIPNELGSNSVVLQQGGQKLSLRLVAPSNVVWSEVDTAKPRHEWDSPNPGTRMMAFEAVAPASGELTLAVVATPGSCEQPIADKFNLESLKKWDINVQR